MRGALLQRKRRKDRLRRAPEPLVYRAGRPVRRESLRLHGRPVLAAIPAALRLRRRQRGRQPARGRGRREGSRARPRRRFGGALRVRRCDVRRGLAILPADERRPAARGRSRDVRARTRWAVDLRAGRDRQRVLLQRGRWRDVPQLPGALTPQGKAVADVTDSSTSRSRAGSGPEPEPRSRSAHRRRRPTRPDSRRACSFEPGCTRQ